MATVATRTQEAILSSLEGSSRRRRKEKVVHGALLLAAGVSMFVSVGIVLALLFRALNFLSDVELGALWAGIWRPRQGQFDLPALFLGSFVVTGIAMLVATPLGLGAAIYLSEYARPRARRTLKPILETLAGIPSVVIGFFALTVINPVVVQGVFGATNSFTMLAAGIGVGLLTIPLDRLRGRGRDVCGPGCPPGGGLRDRCPPPDRHAPRRCSRPRSPGSSPR